MSNLKKRSGKVAGSMKRLRQRVGASRKRNEKRSFWRQMRQAQRREIAAV